MNFLNKRVCVDINAQLNYVPKHILSLINLSKPNIPL